MAGFFNYWCQSCAWALPQVPGITNVPVWDQGLPHWLSETVMRWAWMKISPVNITENR